MDDIQDVEILLVEDDPDDEELTINTLKENNIANKIYVARDGEDALNFLFCNGKYSERANNGHPKLVLLDIKLPKIDGLEVLRQIKLNDNTKSIPVVILTSSDLDRDIIDGYKLGVNSYIQKPVDFQQFQNTVKEIGLYWMLKNKTIFSKRD